MRTVTDEDVYKYLLGDVVVGELYNSPIPGRNDDTPSFKLYEAKNGQLRWRDFGMTNQLEEVGTGVENLIECMRGFSHDKYGFKRARQVIENEVKYGMIGKPPTQFRKRAKSDSVPYIPAANYERFELEYWWRYHLSENDLLVEDIHPVRSMSWEDNGLPSVVSTPADPAFIYWWKRNPASYKIYRPLTADKRNKFRQYNVEGIIEGFNTLHKAEVGFIVSSTKDRLVVKKAFAGKATAINPRGESDNFTIATKINELLSFAPVWHILYDADDPGYVGSNVLHKNLNNDHFKVHDVRGTMGPYKDFSDYVDEQKGNHTLRALNNLISGICDIKK